MRQSDKVNSTLYPGHGDGRNRSSLWDLQPRTEDAGIL